MFTCDGFTPPLAQAGLSFSSMMQNAARGMSQKDMNMRCGRIA